MSKKDKTLKGIKTPSRRKFFKAAAATGAVAAATLCLSLNSLITHNLNKSLCSSSLDDYFIKLDISDNSSTLDVFLMF
jgi:hypothetical protein